MKKHTGDNWVRLAGAALDARDGLRRLIPRLDAAIETGDTSVLVEVRAVTISLCNRLRLSLKHPS
jgi:hypothetical protein